MERRVFMLANGQYAFAQGMGSMPTPEGQSTSYSVSDAIPDEVWFAALQVGQYGFYPVIDGDTVVDILPLNTVS